MKRGGEGEPPDGSDLTKQQYINSGTMLLDLLTMSDQMGLYFKVFSKWKDEMTHSGHSLFIYIYEYISHLHPWPFPLRFSKNY